MGIKIRDIKCPACDKKNALKSLADIFEYDFCFLINGNEREVSGNFISPQYTGKVRATCNCGHVWIMRNNAVLKMDLSFRHTIYNEA